MAVCIRRAAFAYAIALYKSFRLVGDLLCKFERNFF